MWKERKIYEEEELMRAMNLISEPFYFSIKSSLEYVDQCSMLNEHGEDANFCRFSAQYDEEEENENLWVWDGSRDLWGKTEKKYFFCG